MLGASSASSSAVRRRQGSLTVATVGQAQLDHRHVGREVLMGRPVGEVAEGQRRHGDRPRPGRAGEPPLAIQSSPGSSAMAKVGRGALADRLRRCRARRAGSRTRRAPGRAAALLAPVQQVVRRSRGTRLRRCGSRLPARRASVQSMPKRCMAVPFGAAGQNHAVGQVAAQHVVDEGRRQLADAGQAKPGHCARSRAVDVDAIVAAEDHDPRAAVRCCGQRRAGGWTCSRSVAMVRSGRSMPGHQRRWRAETASRSGRRRRRCRS